jgi:hypothetical protein
MKKIIVLFTLLVTIHASAQQKFAIGIKVGQNFSSVNNVYVDRHAASYHIGATVQLGITKAISIVPEVILTQTKLEAGPNPLNLSVNTITKPETYHLNYLAIPVLLQVKPFKGFLLQAGPQYSILVDQKKDGIENASLAFKNGEFSFVGGAKVDLGGFFFYGRYVIGMENVASFKQLQAQLNDEAQWKTKQWQLGVGINLFNF